MSFIAERQLAPSSANCLSAPRLEPVCVAASELAIQGYVELRQVSDAPCDLEAHTDCPNGHRPQRKLGPYNDLRRSDHSALPTVERQSTCLWLDWVEKQTFQLTCDPAKRSPVRVCR